MIGLRGIAGCGADAGVLFQDELVGRKLFVRRITPEFAAHAGVHALGKGFGEPVRQRLGEDRGIVVIGVLETVGDDVLADARGNHEGADIVRHAG